MSDFEPEKGPMGTISMGIDGIETVKQTIHSPMTKYVSSPNRSANPGFYGNASQFGKEEEFFGGYWNDNTDIKFPGSEPVPNNRAVLGNGNSSNRATIPIPKLLSSPEMEKKMKDTVNAASCRVDWTDKRKEIAKQKAKKIEKARTERREAKQKLAMEKQTQNVASVKDANGTATLLMV